MTGPVNPDAVNGDVSHRSGRVHLAATGPCGCDGRRHTTGSTVRTVTVADAVNTPSVAVIT